MIPNIKTALLLDDERSSRHILLDLLNKRGYAVIGCSKPLVAIEILKDNNPFDLIITDYQMEGMNGAEFVSYLRQHELGATIPVIMVSGVISLKEINNLLGNGVDYFLPKPLRLRDVEHYIDLCAASQRGSC
jgi:CheY-like chemotaxis protein